MCNNTVNLQNKVRWSQAEWLSLTPDPLSHSRSLSSNAPLYISVIHGPTLTVCPPLSRYHCMSSTVPPSLSILHCPLIVCHPLSYSHCLSSAVPLSLSVLHCPTLTVCPPLPTLTVCPPLSQFHYKKYYSYDPEVP